MKQMTGYIGKSFARKEGWEKVTGRAKYIDDITFPEMLYGITIRSSVPRAIIKNISFNGDLPWDEFVIVKADDIPANNYVALILNDQPCLAHYHVNHPEEPILLLAHRDKHLLEKARNHVVIDYETLKPALTIEESLHQGNIIWGEDNIFKSIEINKGNVESAWQDTDYIVEDIYYTGAQEQLYIEPQGMIASYDSNEGITIWGSMQCPYYVHKALKELFNFNDHQVRVVQTETGGGFGGKEEYPSMIAAHAALLAWKARRPVKMIYDRAEDMAATTKRHPSRTKIKAGVTKAGKLVALDIEFIIDGGAYCTLSPVVLSRGAIHAAGPYCCPHVRVQAKAVATNVPPHGAFRGFGAPQSIFAMESHLDKIAKTINISELEIRKRNFIKKGDFTATKQLIKEDVDYQSLLTKTLEVSQYQQKRQRFNEFNRTNRKIKKGIGIASFMHGAGFTGSGEKHLASMVGIKATKQGKIQILASSTEIGQGTNTIFSQIAAQALNVDYDLIEVVQPDTANVPNSGPTVASRTCMIVGKLVEKAADEFKTKLFDGGLLRANYDSAEFQQAIQKYLKHHDTLEVFSQYVQPPEISFNEQTYEGDAYATYAWAIYCAEVSIDMLTYHVFVDNFYAVQEVGKVVNPILAQGQIEGGIVQAIGYALYENVVWSRGQMQNNKMTNYIIPTSSDVGNIEVYFVENSSKYGPGGAKGIGELPMDGPAPAILNAMEHALGVRINSIPATEEVIMKAVRRHPEAKPKDLNEILPPRIRSGSK